MRGTTGRPRIAGAGNAPATPGMPGRPKGRHGPHLILARHLTGRHWHGQVTPGCSFWQRSPHEHPAWFSKSGRPTRWRRLHPYQRAMFWWSFYGTIVFGFWLHSVAPAAGRIIIPVVILALLAAAAYLARRAWRNRPVPVPGTVSVTDVAKFLPGCSATRLLTGVTADRKPRYASVDTDSPHCTLSAETGSGKSIAATGLVVPALHNGAVALILDWKRTSYPWARDLPNVRYCNSIASIHDGLMWLRDELERRNKAAEVTMGYDGSYDEDAVGPVLYVIADEMNATAELLGDYWHDELGEKGPSPAAKALRLALFTGRSTRMHTVAIAQQLTAFAAGGGGRQGGASRDCIGVRILIWPSPATVKMLVPDLTPLPETPHIRGRLLVCVGQSVTEVQAVNWEPKLARHYATSGTVTPFPDVLCPSTYETGSDQQDVLGQDTGPELMGLRTAVEELVLAGGCSLETVRKRMQRAGTDAPQIQGRNGSEHLYDAFELRDWLAATVERKSS